MRLTIPQHQLTLSGNTAGALDSLSSGTITLAGGNNITLSQAGNAITISGANLGGAQTGISGIANSETTYTSGTVSLSELGAITIRSTTGNQFQLSVDPQSVQPETQTFIGGISASDTLYTSGTVRITGVGGGVTVSSNTGQRIDISVAAQSVQPETQTFIAGVSASDTLYTSGNVRITGVGGGVTVSSNTGQRIDISVAAQSVQPETQTFIAGISASDTLYTSGNVRFTGVGGGVTVSSNTGQRVDISVAAQSVQPETQTFVGGIGNSQTTYTSGTVNLSVNGGLLTIRSTTGQAFQFSVSQSVQPETQTFIGGIANSQTTYTSGTVSLSELGAITIRSTTGNQYQLSVNSQTVQTQGVLSVGLSTGGNTSGNTTVNTGSRFVIVGSNGITASQGTAAGATTVTLSGITQSVQTQGVLSAGVSTGGNTAGNTTVNTGSRLVLAGAGDISLSQATAGGATTISISGTQTVQTQDVLSVGASNLGNTAGNTTVNTGSRFVLVGTNMISLSQTTGAGATTLSIAATQSAQTQSNIQALYDGANSITTGTVRLTNANGVSFSVNAQTLSASVNESISMFAVSNTTQSTSGTAHKSALSFAGAGIASVGVTGGSVVVSVPSGGGEGDGGVFAGVSSMGNTAGSTGTVSTGNFVLVGTGPISLSQSTGAAGSAATVSINGPTVSSLSATGIVSIESNGDTISIGAPANTNLSIGVSTGGNTAGNTTVNTGSRLVLVGTNGITASQGTAAGATTITLSGVTQSVQTQDVLSVGISTGGNTAGNTTVNTGSRFVLVGSGLVSASQATAAGATTVTLNATNQNLSMGVSNVGNTSGNTTVNTGSRFVIVGSNGITASQGTAAGATTVTLSGITQSVQTQDVLSIGVSTGGNTAGNTTVNTGSRLVLAGGANITLSQATAAGATTVSIAGGAGGGGGSFSGGVSNLGNTAGATGITGTQMVLVGTGVMSLSQTTGANGGTVSVIGPATSSLSATGQVSISTNGSTISIGVPDPVTLSYFNPQDAYVQVAGQHGQATLHMQPMQVPNVQFDRAVFPVILTISNATSVGSHTLSFWQGIYTRTGSTLSLSTSWSTARAITVGTSNSSLFGVMKLMTIPITHTLTEGQYYIANIYRTTTGGANNMTFSQVVASQMNSNLSGHFGSANNATIQYTRGLGHYTVSTSGLPASIAFSHINGTASMALRQPIFYLASGTF